jgi:hypothetical protein
MPKSAHGASSVLPARLAVDMKWRLVPIQSSGNPDFRSLSHFGSQGIALLYYYPRICSQAATIFSRPSPKDARE